MAKNQTKPNQYKNPPVVDNEWVKDLFIDVYELSVASVVLSHSSIFRACVLHVEQNKNMPLLKINDPLDYLCTIIVQIM